MSKISLRVARSTNLMAVVRCLRPITGQSIAKIREAIESGSVLFQQTLFFNDHDEIAGQLWRILASFEESGIAFEVFEDEDLISTDVLRNILDAPTIAELEAGRRLHTMSELPTLLSLFTPPLEQKIEPGQSHDYVGVYSVDSHLAVVTKQPPGFSFPSIELWRPVFGCAMPIDIQAVGGGYFVIWFTGVPSERGRYGDCVREVCITGITRCEQGRELRPDEYVR